MATIPFHYELPKKLSVKKFIGKLSKKTTLQISAQQYSLKSFYDSFDWRLYQAGLYCELNQSQTASVLSIINRKTGVVVRQENLDEIQKFADDFESPEIRSTLQPFLEMRALLTLSTLPYQAYRINILNKDKKPQLRLTIEEHELIPSRVILEPLNDHKHTITFIAKLFSEELQLKPARRSILNESLKLQGRKAKDYSSKIILPLDPDMHANIAGKYIFSHLLTTIKANEAGTIADIDSEFLHDFRVSVRKTRAGLSQLKYIFPADITATYSEYFAWLGQITSHTRDMDVYLLNFNHYKASLPVAIREDLNPLYDFIEEKQRSAQKELAQKLRSTKYLSMLNEWEQFLKQPAQQNPTHNNAHLPIKKLADQRIWKTYRRILKEGNAIDDTTPAIALHDLRKTCKKLRYLMEFFQSLYPETEIKTLIKVLKGLQEVLGDFQDYEVQEIALKQYSEEMRAAGTPAKTFLAIGLLVRKLDARRLQARKDFSGQFSKFTLKKHQTTYHTLFS